MDTMSNIETPTGCVWAVLKERAVKSTATTEAKLVTQRYWWRETPRAGGLMVSASVSDAKLWRSAERALKFAREKHRAEREGWQWRAVPIKLIAMQVGS